MKGWELLKEIAEGKIKEGTKVKSPNGVIYKYNTFSFKDENGNFMNEEFSDREYATLDFEIIEDQEGINIQDIEELDKWITRRNGEVTVTEGKILEIGNKVNEIIQALKQLDERIKNENRN